MAKQDTDPADAAAPQAPDAPVAPGEDIGQAEVQAKVDAAEDQGYLGTTPDPTPNEAYTVSGVVRGAPTPETDPAAAEAARRMADRNPPPPQKSK